MISNPTPGDVPDLQDRDAAYFASWLKDGLRRLIQFALTGAEAFEGGAGPFLGWVDDRTSELHAVYQAIYPGRGRTAFAEGCADALSDMRFDNTYDALIARELLKLGARIHAREVLERFADLSHTWFGPHHGVDLLRTALDAARSLARPDTSGTLAEAVLHLTRHPGFQPAQARSTLITLCTIAPEDLLDHLRNLGEPLERRYGRVENNANEERVRTARRRTLILEVAACVTSDFTLACSVVPQTRLRTGVSSQATDIDDDWWTQTWISRDDLSVVKLFDARIRPMDARVADFVVSYMGKTAQFAFSPMSRLDWRRSTLQVSEEDFQP